MFWREREGEPGKAPSFPALTAGQGASVDFYPAWHASRAKPDGKTGLRGILTGFI